MICKGDSGGPMICHGKQYGIASNYYHYYNKDNSQTKSEHSDCGNDGLQTRHLFIYPYKGWISAVITNTGESVTTGQKLHTVLLMLAFCQYLAF